jgi:(p)ppGpp synthase/HD superfamily hydrolase
MTEKFSKLYIALKFRMHGSKFFKGMEALEYGRKIHAGTRKDGITPEFQHQLEIAKYLTTLSGSVPDLEGLIITALLHDTDEDYPFQIPFGKLESFGEERAKSIMLLNKHRHLSMEEYFAALALDARAALVKGADRINNFQSMKRGNFSLEKQDRYAAEVRDYFLPMLKEARKNFPEYMDAFYNIETILKFQYELITDRLMVEKRNATAA